MAALIEFSKINFLTVLKGIVLKEISIQVKVLLGVGMVDFTYLKLLVMRQI